MTELKQQSTTRGLKIEPWFSVPSVNPFGEVEWETRTALITGEDGKPVFEQRGVEFPKFWSQNATNVVASKYFRGPLGSPQRESSVKQLIGRVAGAITEWGLKDGYFASHQDTEIFRNELTHLLLHQKLAFNSPVWFNVGVEKNPQCSACFILSVEDTMESILDWIRKEGIIFKGGSGSGVNLSRLRSSKEKLSSGGEASGPVSFMRGADASAGAIKSGGKTRRAAKMVVLDVDHPDIVDFIWSKAKEERKAYALGMAGYDMSLNGEAWISIQYQNANNSVRVTDEFMRAAIDDRDWNLTARTTKEVLATVKARDLLRMCAEAAWECGDPGFQYDTTINSWHTCPNSGRINASNPCSEYMHLDDSACNLASLNLMKFVDEVGEFDVEAFRRAVQISIIAQDILVDNSSYPTEKITENAHNYRELGLGYANLGALLMAQGIPYDSDRGRSWAAAITAIMTAEAYTTSSRLAQHLGPFSGYSTNREAMLKVITHHAESVNAIDSEAVPGKLLNAARKVWDEALALGEVSGYRNSQATVIAPTGTISFIMDCDTTGIEPDIALVKYKRLVGGGTIKMVNRTVPTALVRLGYAPDQIKEILDYVDRHGMIEGAPPLKAEDLPVFDCAFRPANGSRAIHHMGHIRMMAAVQPFISGAISKTVNLPNESAVQDIQEAFIEGWRLELKALAIYRDGSKKAQPLGTESQQLSKLGKPARRRLPAERQALTHKFTVGGQEGYLTVGLFEDGQPGEVFLTIAKEGSTISGLFDVTATETSIALQYGVPLKDLVRKFINTRFEPAGITDHPKIRFASSIIDYVFRWLALKFLPYEDQVELSLVAKPVEQAERQDSKVDQTPFLTSVTPYSQFEGPPCYQCGAIMIRDGACYRCHNCGTTSGCS